MSRRSEAVGAPGAASLIVIALVLAAGLLLVDVGPANAEQPSSGAAAPPWAIWLNERLPFSLNVTGIDVEAGGRIVRGDTDAAKFEEYRVLDENPFVDHARISLETKDKKRYVEISAIHPFKGDQSYLLRAGKYGGYDLEIFWDQIPHRLSTTGRTLFSTAVSGGVADLTLPPGVASTVGAAPAATRAAVLAGFLANAGGVPLEFLTSKGGLGVRYALSDALDVGVRYTFTQKEGTIPFGAGFGSPGGSVVELPAPLFNRTHLVEAKTQYAARWWNAGFGYTASIFDQGIDNVTFDNPLSATNSATLSARGRTTMDPNNQAHNVFATGGVSLPLRTRITGKVSYGWRLQNDPFVPHTINPALASDPQLALPRNSLDGDIRTTLVTVNATSRPFAMPLTLRGGYRFYDFDNRSPEIVFPAHTVRDVSLTVDERVNAPFSYSKHNAHLDAGYPLLRALHVKLGYEWERWDRDPRHREVPTSDEHFLKSSLDFTPLDWLLFRASYRRGWRTIDKYVPQAHEVHVVLDIEGEEFGPGVPNPQGQSPLLRKFDQADRTRDRVEVLASVTPLESLNFTATYSLLFDDFDRSRPPQSTSDDPSPHDTSALSLRESRGWSAGGDLVYSPFPWLSLFVNYMREEFRYDQLSRSRPVAAGETLDFTDFNWRSVNRDKVDTYGAGADVSLIPDRLDLRLTYTFSDADTRIESFNPVPPTSGTGAQNTTATAVNYPLANTNLHTLIAALRYHLTRNWSVKAEYRWEQFRETDWATDAIGLSGLTNLPPTTDVFLGARFLQDYDAHIAAVTVRYRF